jgi:SprT protein
MPKKEAPLEYLQQFVPEGSVRLLLDYLHAYKIHLTITRERKSILGDYRHATRTHNHRISINGNLNKFSFLITLVHELAHLITFIQYGNEVPSHGKEWKFVYRKMLEEFISLSLFPPDILSALKKSLHNPPATSCGDEDLMRVLRRHDPQKSDLLLVEQLPEGHLFTIDNGKLFKKGKKIRKRIQCVEVATGKLFLFSPIYEVKVV